MWPNLGKCFIEALDLVLGDCISTKLTLISKEDSSYSKCSGLNGLRLVQIKGGMSLKGIFHMHHLNTYHTKLSTFVASFKDISSKYLNNYLISDNVVEHMGGSL